MENNKDFPKLFQALFILAVLLGVDLRAVSADLNVFLFLNVITPIDPAEPT
jgi:hypothetical protein